MTWKFFVEPSIKEPDQLVRIEGGRAEQIGPNKSTWTQVNSLRSMEWDSSGMVGANSDKR